MSITVFHGRTAQEDVNVFPLSLAQERLWILNQVKSDHTFNALSTIVHVRRALNAQMLVYSLNALIQRHDALRTTFQVREGQPLQMIAPCLNISLPVTDLRVLSKAQQEAEVLRLTTEERQRPFDLTKGPLVRASLLQLAAEEYMLLLNMHHLVCDRWSMNVSLRELIALYEAFASGRPSPLSEPPLSYADFVQQQQAWLKENAAAEQLNYWKQQLAEIPVSLDLPTDHPHSLKPTLRNSTYELALPRRLSKALRELGQREKVSLDIILVAVLQMLLYRYSEQEDVPIGMVTANRLSAESEAMIGLCENVLTLRTILSGDLSFRELLGRVREVLLQARMHQELPFEYLVKELHPTHAPGHNPFFQVMLTLTPPSTPPSPEWTATRMVIEAGSSLYDLNLNVEERAEGLLTHFEYNCDMFNEATIGRMAGHWQTLLEGVVAAPDKSLASLPLLTEQERHRLLIEWNTPQVEYFQGCCVYELFEMQVERTPETVAVVCEEHSLTYGELNRRANHLAHHLRQLGIREEVPVGICVERSLEMVVGLLGILKAGGVHVPLDAAFPTERLAFMMEDTGMPILLTQQHLLTRFPTSHPQLVCLDSDWATISQQPATNPAHVVKGEHLAYIMYTSGSTGQPKGVLIEHHALAAHCGAIIQAQELSANDCVLQFNAFTFDASLEQIFPPLLVGARLVLRGPEIWSPADLLYQVKEHQLTVITMPCDYWHEVISEWSLIPQQLAGQRLRLVIAGGDRLPPEAVQLWRQSPLHTARLFNVYGPTEATITTTIFDIPCHPEREQAAASIPIGRPLPNRTVYILDKLGQPVPEGVAGELYIGGDLLACGYLNRPELMAERFIADPFSQKPQARLYKTGDIARHRHGGIIEFIGRADQQVKLRGYRVELGEIEAAIKRHPAVHQVLVVTREDTPGFKRLLAYVIPQPAQETSQLAAQLHNLLKEHLPDYMIPAAFVLLEAFPLNASGKVDRQALPVPDFTKSEGVGRLEGFVAPRTSLEEIVANTWAQALGIRQISIHDDFFVLGGHSLLAMQVTSRLQALFHVNVPLRRFFEAPTVAQLAETISHLQATHSQSHQPALQKHRQEQALPTFPVSLTQEGLWFLHQLEPESVNYNIYVVQRVHRSLAVPTLERSLNALVQRHDALHTTFGTHEGKAVQIIAPALALTIPVHDLQYLSEHEQEIEVQRLARTEAQRPFNLAQGPLLRATLLRLAPEESILLLTVHHVIADGWSLNILLPELSSLYEAFASGQPSSLLDLPLQYTDFAIWQRELLQEGHFAEHLAYWERRLANLPDALELPIDHPRTAQFSAQGATYLLTLPQTLTDKLQYLSRQQGVTLYMMLVAAFQTLLYRYTGQEDLVIGTVAANRQAETEALVGFFVNTLVLRTDLSGDPGFVALLARVREVVLDAQAHQELPFASQVKAIRPERQAGRNPLFQVMMSFDTPLARLPQAWEPVDLGNLTTTAQFELSLEVQEGPEGLRCHFEYSTDLFDEATIARLAGHWQTLLTGIVAQPDQSLSTLPLLTEQEHQQLQVEWNATQREYPLEQCAHQLFEAQVEQTPDAVAVICEGEQLSYRELNARANQLAHHLHKCGVGPETLVALLTERGIPFLIFILAVFKAGGAYLPLDPHHPAARLRRVIEHSRCHIVLVSTAFAPTLAQALEDVPTEQRPEALSYEEILKGWQASQNEENLPIISTPRALAYVMYTSGSTGMPKGAMVEQRGMLNHLYAKIEALTLMNRDIVAQTASQCFDISVWQFLAALLVGGSVQIYPDEITHDPVQLLMQIERHQVSILETVPSLLRAMLDADEIAASSRPKLETLRWLVPTGEALPVGLCRRWLSIYPHVPLLNAYGPTECSDDVTHYPIYEAPDETRSAIPIGRAIPHMQLYVLDRHLEPLPIGVSGELYVGGVGVGRGYLGDEQRTAEAFVTDPFGSQAGARLYKTGDLARYLPDGNLEFLGRLDFQVKLRGFRIEMGEIEAVLSQHPAVRQAVVMVREDTPGDKRLVAYVELQKEQSTTAAELKNHVMMHVPTYMVPSAFILLERLPLTSNGKVDRRALPAPDPGRSVVEESYVAPGLPVEQQMVQIWEELLAMQPIGIKDDFFELGGDSLLAVRLFERIAQVCGKKLPLSTLFAGATIEHLAQALGGETRIDGRAPLVVVQEEGSRRPFFYLHGEWKGGGLYSRELARYQGREQPFYLLEPYKFEGLTIPPTFEEVAAAHLATMRSLQPEGPYFLSGYCNGGLLAYEMARQMQEQGLKVGLVLLMDPDFPARHGMVRTIIRHIGNVLRIGQEKQFEWFLCLQHVYRYLRFAHYRRSTNATLLGNVKQDEPEDKTSQTSMASSSFKLQALLPKVETLRQDWSNIYDWLVANYTPSLYPGKITFFWTSEEPERSEGWQEVMKAKEGEVEIYINPGNHISGRTEYLPVLAERLRECLNKAQAAIES
jgi:amino acid adenylation domain-containing protein